MRLARSFLVGWSPHCEHESRNPAIGLFAVRPFEVQARRGASLELA